MNFRTIGYYESIVDHHDDSKAQGVVEFINNSDFISYDKSNPSTNIFNDEFMGAILNPDRVVKIAEWFIKIDPVSEKVFVISDEIENAYSVLLREDTRDPNLKVLTTSDDVTYLLQHPEDMNVPGIGCGETGIGNYVVTFDDVNIFANEWLFDGELRFAKFGIYYKLYALATSNISGVYKLYIDLEPVYYHVKCGYTTGPYNVYNYQNNSAYAPTQKYTSYQGSKNLNEVYFRGRIHAQYVHTNGVVYNAYTPWKQIQVNY